MRYDEFLFKLHDSWDPLTETDVIALEKEMGATLPNDYREFLLRRNGGRFYEPIVFRIPTNDPYVDEAGLLTFLGLNLPPDENFADIRSVRRTHLGRILEGFLPIAHSGNQMLLLQLDAGKVYLWQRDIETELAVEENAVFVTESFDDFVSGCYMKSVEPRDHMEREQPFRAIEGFELHTLQRFLDEGGALEGTNAQGYTPLVAACLYSNLDAAEELLRRGADPNAVNPRNGSPCLAMVAHAGQVDFMKLLIRYGAGRAIAVRTDADILEFLDKKIPHPTERVRNLLKSLPD